MHDMPFFSAFHTEEVAGKRTNPLVVHGCISAQRGHEITMCPVVLVLCVQPVLGLYGSPVTCMICGDVIRFAFVVWHSCLTNPTVPTRTEECSRYSQKKKGTENERRR